MTDYLQCQFCPAQWEVSKEDPDATLAAGIEHIAQHPDGVTINPAFALYLSDVSRT